MKMFFRSAITATLIGCLISAASPVQGYADDAASIAAVRTAWMQAINTRDVDSLLSLYEPGAVVFPEDAPPQLGPPAISAWHGRLSADADVYYELEGQLVRIDGGWALEEWTAEVTVLPEGERGNCICGDPLQFRQQGVRVYRKDARGRWHIDRETWSADHPAIARLIGEPMGYPLRLLPS